jgi:hypothetical protein
MKLSENTFSLTIDKLAVHPTESTKFLGTLIDRRMSWNEHRDFIATKLSKIMAITSRLKHYLPIPILKIIYMSLFYPHLQYGITSWYSASSHNKRIFKLQKKMIRYITKSHYLAHTDSLFKNFGILKLEDIFKIKVVSLYYKFKKLQCTPFIQHKISALCSTLSQTAHLRYPCIELPKISREYEKQMLCYKIARVINDLNLATDTVSTENLQKYFLSSYSTICKDKQCYACRSSLVTLI